MKTNYLTFVLMSIFFMLSCNSHPSQDEVNKYIDVVAEQENSILQKINDLIDGYDSYNDYSSTDQMQKAYNAVYAQLDSAEQVINKQGDFYGDEMLKKSAQEFIQSIRQLMDNEHKRIIELYSLPDDRFTEKEQEEMEKLRDTAGQKADEIRQKAEKTLNEFTEKYADNQN